MKKCDHFKDLILTDYLDGEADKSVAGILENHLLDCSDCRTFFKEVKNNTSLPFQQATRQVVPKELWGAIKKDIEDANHPQNPLVGFMENLKGLLILPRLIPVLASLAVMLLVGSVTLNNIQTQQAQAKDQGEYLVSLLSSTSQAENNDSGTAIEHYFL